MTINPVELFIFCIVALLFLNSVYRLFFGWESLDAAPKALNEAPKSTPATEAVSPQAATSPLEITCNTPLHLETPHAKIRIVGPLCENEDAAPKTTRKLAQAKASDAEITNHTNQFKASVFTYTEANKFSTDYIPLANGNNEIRITYKLTTGANYQQRVVVLRKNHI